MVKLRTDIYPKLQDSFLTTTRRSFLDGQIDICRQAFQSKFRRKTDVVMFLNSLPEPNQAELLLDISAYFYVTKRDIKQDYIRLIMLFSMIEKLKIVHHIDYNGWLKQKNNPNLNNKIASFVSSYPENLNENEVKHFLICVSKTYTRKYGATNAVYEFFKKYLSKEDKIRLIRSFQTKRQKYVERYSKALRPRSKGIKCIEDLSSLNFKVEKGLLPRCYDWKYCRIEYGKCGSTCKLKTDSKLLKKELKYIVSLMYTFRSKFVHSTKIPPVGTSPVLDVYNHKLIHNDLDFNKFISVIEQGVLKHFESMITTHKN